jgi:hypothetical protein
VRRLVLLTGIAVLIASALPGVAAAQEEDPPTELWSEYPLVQEPERSSTPSIGPFLPPTPPESPSAGDPVNWGLWALVAALGVGAALVALRVARTAAAPAIEEPFLLHAPTEPQVYRPGPLAQYAPTRDPEPADGLVEEPPRSIVLRSGLLRARYVVVADEWAGGLEAVGGSKSFWRIGPSGLRERLSDEAWDDLVNELRLQGWEPNSLRRSDYYVLLQRVEPEPFTLGQTHPS